MHRAYEDAPPRAQFLQRHRLPRRRPALDARACMGTQPGDDQRIAHSHRHLTFGLTGNPIRQLGQTANTCVAISTNVRHPAAQVRKIRGAFG
jgi:hypothetical protein